MAEVSRLRAARTLKDRAFPSDAKDVRDGHRSEMKNEHATGRPKDLDDASYLVKKLYGTVRILQSPRRATARDQPPPPFFATRFFSAS